MSNKESVMKYIRDFTYNDDNFLDNFHMSGIRDHISLLMSENMLIDADTIEEVRKIEKCSSEIITSEEAILEIKRVLNLIIMDLESDKEIVIKKLKDLRHNYIDTIPKEYVRLEDINYYRYKCRVSFLTLVKVKMLRLISKKMLNKASTIKLVEKFIEERDSKRRGPTKKEEIDMVNNVLDVVIMDLEKK